MRISKGRNGKPNLGLGTVIIMPSHTHPDSRHRPHFLLSLSQESGGTGESRWKGKWQPALPSQAYGK